MTPKFIYLLFAMYNANKANALHAGFEIRPL